MTVTVTAHGFETATQIRSGDPRRATDEISTGLLLPIPVLEHELTTLTDQNGNGKVEPGETFQVDEQLINTGHATATGVNATLSTTTPGIEITQATSTYPDIVEGGTGHELDALRRGRDERAPVRDADPAAADRDDQ